MKVSEMEGDDLDRWVSIAIGWKRYGDDDHRRPLHRPSKDRPGTVFNDWDSKGQHPRYVSPDKSQTLYLCGCEGDVYRFPEYSTDWSQGGPLVERYRIMFDGDLTLDVTAQNDFQWSARIYGEGMAMSGPTPLIAAMRALVASKFGKEVCDDPTP